MKKLRYKINLIEKKALFSLVFVLGIILLASGIKVTQAEWIEPSSPPPLEQLAPPLTTGGEDQAKKGYLLLDPNYNPTQATSLIFSPKRPLEVRGAGAKFFTPYLYSDLLTVGTDTLYVDSGGNWVGIGTSTQLSVDKFEIVGGTVQVGTKAVPISGRTVSGYSSDNVGVFGSAGTNGQVGVYGYSNVSGGYGVRGTSVNSVGVRGESIDGKGIHAINQSQSLGAVFGSNSNGGLAGYFDGRLNSVADMVARTFLPTVLPGSLIPFTSGQELQVYDFGNWGASYPAKARIAFDGTYLWLGTDVIDTNGYNFYKIRVSDGMTVGAYTVGTGYEAIIFDGTYLWLSSDADGSIYRFNPVTGISDSVIGLSSNIKYSLSVSTVNGQVYVWATDLAANRVVKINAANRSFETFSLVATGATAPYQLTFDGEYVWVATQSDHIIRLWAEDPDDAGNPMTAWDVSANCIPNNIFFDGVYLWCLEGSDGKLLRIWADDPNNAQHPMTSFGPAVSNNEDMAFDGTYLWVVNSSNSKLYRYLAADPTQYTEYNLAFQPERIVFDGTYLWLSEADGVGVPKLHKYYSGTGLGHTDLSTVVNLQTNVGRCSVATTQECIFDWHCPIAETCNTNISSQPGNINITGSAELKKDHCFNTDSNTHLYANACTQDSDCSGGEIICVGGDINVGTDIDAVNNQWGSSGEDVAVSGGIAVCSDGQFVKGVTIDSGGFITSIHCREL
ncbi:hypothetical protein IID19_03600 [Patescibacteria group bacterium]|nr:hypothetical protein [Patescibacteria group bacterium]